MILLVNSRYSGKIFKKMEARNDIYIYIPAGKESISVKIDEAKEIRDVVSQFDFKRGLEVGLAFGMSANYILSSNDSITLTSIDPFQEQDYANNGLENLKKNGFHKRHEHINELSELALPELLRKEERFDFIFIDGDHKFEGALIDFYYASKLIEKGGIIILDDLWMRGLRLVKSYIEANREDFEVVNLTSKNLFGFRKIGNDRRDGMHFKEFYSAIGFLKYHVNRLAWENNTPLGRAINKLKSLR